MKASRTFSARANARLGLLALSLVLVLPAPVAAHGGHQPAAADPAPWLLALLYLQLVAMPFIGLFLLRQAGNAWLGPRAWPKGRKGE